MRTLRCLPVIALAITLVPGCADSHTHDRDDASSARPDARVDAAQVDAGTRCGDEICGEGEACCPGCPGEPSLGCTPGGCPPVACFVCASSADCSPDEYCDFTTFGCDGPGTCMPRPTGCPEDCPGVCGCDGVLYCNACSANEQGASVRHEGACGAPECEPQDARAEGACLLFLGFAWDGEACQGLGGCTCVGDDCDELYTDVELCEVAYAGCFIDD